MKSCLKILYFFILTGNAFAANAQQSSDTLYNQAIAVYTNATGVNEHLFNGAEYIDYDHRITGNPFFNAEYFSSGSITYYGIKYNSRQMFYDILNDDVILKNYNDSALILVKEKISSFNLDEHYFIKLDSLTKGIKGSGFYDILYDGETRLVAKRKKSIVEKISTQYYESYFSEHTSYFIFKDGKYYEAGDKKSALTILQPHKKELIKFMHQHKINYRLNNESALIKMVGYYDSINKAK